MGRGHRGQKRPWDPLALELKVTVNHLRKALKQGAISPAHTPTVISYPFMLTPGGGGGRELSSSSRVQNLNMIQSSW